MRARITRVSVLLLTALITTPAVAQTRVLEWLTPAEWALAAVAALGVALTVIFFATLWNRQLRAQVRERTAELEQKAAALAEEIEIRRAAEESQARLAGIIEATTDFVAVANVDGSVQYMNRAGRALVGIAQDAPLHELEVRSLNTEEEYRQLLEIRLPAVEKSGMWSGQATFRAVNGREIPVLQVILAHRAADGTISHISTIARDITVLKRNELTLRERERQLMTLMRNLPGMAYRCANDPDWTMKFVSDGVYELTGYTPEELINNTVMAYGDLIHPDDRQSVWDAVQAALEDHRPYQMLYRLRARDGGERWVWEHGRGVFTRRTGRLVALEGFVADITQRRSAELAAGQMREYLQNVIDSMPSVLVGVDERARVTHWNAEAERFSGWSAAAALGASVTELLPLLREDTPQIHSAIMNQLPSKSSRTAYDSAGVERHYEVMIYPLAARGIGGAVIRLDDVSQRARMEAMMAQTEKMMLVGGLAAGMAHEINNPLGGILQACANILRRVAPDRPDNRNVAQAHEVTLEQVRGYLEQRQVFEFIASIQEASGRASKIVADMLAFSRSGDTHLIETEVRPLLETMVRLAANDMDMRLADGRRVALEVECPDDIGTVQCDGTKIQQVLLNLVRNALQALRDGAAESPAIVVRATREAEHLLIEVEDNGPGMDEETRRRAFEPFFTTKGVGVGTGLGLSVSYFLIVEQHKGEIHVESQPGRGARFVIRLPLGKA